MQEPPDTRRLVTCRHFQAGYCRSGTACPFRHDEGTRAARPAPMAVRQECIFFLQGRCMKGALCPFFHDPTRVVPLEARLNSALASGPPFPFVPLSFAHTSGPIDDNLMIHLDSPSSAAAGIQSTHHWEGLQQQPDLHGPQGLAMLRASEAHAGNGQDALSGLRAGREAGQGMLAARPQKRTAEQTLEEEGVPVQRLPRQQERLGQRQTQARTGFPERQAGQRSSAAERQGPTLKLSTPHSAVSSTSRAAAGSRAASVARGLEPLAGAPNTKKRSVFERLGLGNATAYSKQSTSTEAGDEPARVLSSKRKTGGDDAAGLPARRPAAAPKDVKRTRLSPEATAGPPVQMKNASVYGRDGFLKDSLPKAKPRVQVIEQPRIVPTALKQPPTTNSVVDSEQTIAFKPPKSREELRKEREFKQKTQTVEQRRLPSSQAHQPVAERGQHTLEEAAAALGRDVTSGSGTTSISQSASKSASSAAPTGHNQPRPHSTAARPSSGAAATSTGSNHRVISREAAPTPVAGADHLSTNTCAVATKGGAEAAPAGPALGSTQQHAEEQADTVAAEEFLWEDDLEPAYGGEDGDEGAAAVDDDFEKELQQFEHAFS